MHKKRRTIRTIRENLERVNTINPRRKTLEEKKKHITKKKKKGAANPIPAAAPFSLFGFSSPVSISPPSNTFHSSISTPRSCNSS
jgi:hypothetical protein